jgi:hypothetical protein
MTTVGPSEPSDRDGLVEPDGSASTEQVEYGEETHSVLTPMGQIESYGNFARGLGARRVKIGAAAVLLGAIVLIAISEL